MDSEKKKRLEESFDRIINVGFCIIPHEDLSDIIDTKPVVFGTTKDEKIFSIEGVDALFKSQFEQMGGMQPSLDRKRIARRISPDENSAFIVEEITLTLSSSGEVNTIFMRASCVMEYHDNNWKLTHWHASTPVDTENDHWHQEEWKREKEKLQKLVDQQTADLKRQNRELEIEAALERVRSKSMGMQHSDELNDVLSVLFQQFDILGIRPVTAFLSLFDMEKNTFTYRSTSKAGNRMQTQQVVDLDSLDVWKNLSEKWKNDKQDSIEVIFYPAEVLEELFGLLDETFSAMPEQERLTVDDFPEGGYAVHGYCKFGYIGYNHHRPPTDEEEEILIKFAKEFGRVYQRFLDIQKAEAQGREAHIEAALERVRARSMGMQKSEELTHVVRQIGEELKELGVEVHNSHIWTDISLGPTGSLNIWIHVEGQSYLEKFHFPLSDHPIDSELKEAIDKGQTFFAGTYTKSEAAPYFRYAFEETDLKKIPQERKDIILNAPGWTRFTVVLEESCLHFGRFNLNEFTEDEQDIFKRLGNVFGQAYTRFLDLKKAEEQAREAQIEAALEKVRSRSMGMQKSDDLIQVVREIGGGIHELGIDTDNSQIFTDYSHDPKDGLNIWIDVEGQNYLEKFHIPYIDHFITQYIYKASNEGQDFFGNQFSKSDKDSYFKLLFKYSNLKNIPNERKELIFNAPGWTKIIVVLDEASLHFDRFSLENFTDEEKEIFKRFGKVFGQAYTRFLDLQKAEAQAREAQIEAALERVRSRSMGMQKSEDLRSVVDTIYGEFQHLNVDFHVAAIQLIPDDSMDLHLWLSTADGMYDDIVHWPYTDLPIFHQIYKSRTGDKMLEYTTGETETREFFEEYFKLDVVPKERKKATKNVKVIDFAGAYQEHTGIFLMRYTEGAFSSHEKDIISRFSKVFEQTYTRFLDIQRAEKLALETARQSSLDRIRAEIGTMRSAEDLNQITPIIWDELKTLGIPFIRCGVFIIDEQNGISDTYLSTSQGEPIAALHLPIEGISLVENAVASWKKKKIYTEHWDKKDFRSWTQNLIDKGFIESKKKYEAGSAPETLDLHFLPFKHGMLYIGNTEPLSQEKLDLGQSMADAFSAAYDRYEDFNKLEQAKQKIEEAFKELEAAKDQLVQQEKLASLGQLTAGIAHEIKNPLNFVNNFSDLSTELIQEVRDEIQSVGAIHELPLQDVHDILNDIESNLKTIHKHGTRADSIVKSMLQHSRGGSGKMEPTNMNALIKEYANLAFHGMRAGKDPINVDIELDLDKNIGDIGLIAEDFSRVILNLCNNAFDAMREKLSAVSSQQSAHSPFSLSRNVGEGGSGDGSLDEYEPKLTIRTHRDDVAVTIEIEDNGPGIPDTIKDKIMQPFFTTKKGTAGTGLGLSITNDIVKAHGGNLEVYSDASTGTRFNIHLSATG